MLQKALLLMDVVILVFFLSITLTFRYIFYDQQYFASYRFCLNQEKPLIDGKYTYIPLTFTVLTENRTHHLLDDEYRNNYLLHEENIYFEYFLSMFLYKEINILTNAFLELYFELKNNYNINNFLKMLKKS